jgi:hypothetical protein
MAHKQIVVVEGVPVTITGQVLDRDVLLEFTKYALQQMQATPLKLQIEFNDVRQCPRRYGTFYWGASWKRPARIYIWCRGREWRNTCHTIAHELGHAQDFALGTIKPRTRAAREQYAEAIAHDWAGQWIATWKHAIEPMQSAAHSAPQASDVIWTRRNRVTHELVTVARTSTAWRATCEAHQVSHTMRTRPSAERMGRHPWTFCPKCAQRLAL